MSKVLYIRLSDEDHAMCEKAASMARLSLASWARHNLVAKIAEAATASKPLTATQTRAEAKAAEKADLEARIAASHAAWVAECIDIMTNGRNGETNIQPWQIRSMFMDNPPAAKARFEAGLKEAMAKIGMGEDGVMQPSDGWVEK